MKRLAILVVLLLASAPAWAKMQTRTVEWTLGKQAFSGVLVYDDATATKRPGLLMVPDWKGVAPASVATAGKIAGTRYVILVADVYGRNVRPKNDAEALAQVKSLYADRAMLRARAVSLRDIVLTLSVRSFQVPATPRTSA